MVSNNTIYNNKLKKKLIVQKYSVQVSKISITAFYSPPYFLLPKFLINIIFVCESNLIFKQSTFFVFSYAATNRRRC